MKPFPADVDRAVAPHRVDDPARRAAAEPFDARVTRERRHRRAYGASFVAVALGAAGCFLAVSWMIDGGRQKRGTRFDRAILRWAGGARRPAGNPFARGLSFCGSLPAVLALSGAALCIARPRPRVAWQIVAGATGGVVAEVGIKHVFRRQRPRLLAHAAKVSSSSFPSGHSMAAASFYSTLALLASRSDALQQHRAALLGGAALFASAIGATRVYLGVHWPTDVLGGLALGTAWASTAEAAFELTGAHRLRSSAEEIAQTAPLAKRPSASPPRGRRTSAKPRAALVFNPAAGCAGSGIDRIRAALAERFDLDVHETSAALDADRCAEAALAFNPDIVIGAGGDGTISMVARALVGRDVALGILPLGTSNSIAAALGIPGDPEAALGTLFDGETCALDTADANGRSMMLHASIGFHAATVANTPSDAKQRWGSLAYLKEALAGLTDIEPFEVELLVDDAIVRCRANNLMIANLAPSKTILAQGPRVLSPDDGMLDITIVSATSLGEAVVTGMHLFRSALMKECATRDNVGFLSARSVRIATSPAQPILIDGEDAGEGDLLVRCRPRSLQVRVPRHREVVVPALHERKLAGLPDLEIVAKAAADR